MHFKLYRLPATLALVTYLTLSKWIVLGVHADQCRLASNRATNPDLEPPTNSGPTFPTNGTESPPTQTRTDSAGGSGTSSSGSTAIPTATIAAFDYANDKVRGVNLGGWLVLEPWITPSVFEKTGNRDIIDEYTLGQLMDRQDADALLKQHWETWITEDDFVAIKAAGLNHVRIPVGYWSVPITSGDTSYPTSPDPYIPGAWPYLLRGLNWARKHGVHVILDLHGAPGSQNGYDNSGQRTGSPRWALDQDNVGRTVDVVKFIAQNVGGLIDVLELLNEPAGFRGDAWETAVRGFWEDGYNAVREVAGEEIKVMIGDAFLGVNHWTNFLVPPRGHDVLMDFVREYFPVHTILSLPLTPHADSQHEYQIFSDDQLDRSVDEHVEFACRYTQTLPNFAAGNIWTVVGEWSNAITDCARWLNGRNVGARWDNTYSDTGRYHGSCDGYTGSFGNFSDSYRQTLRRYFEVQIEIGERVQGWVFWTWKAEDADEWSYQRGLEGGWVPRDPTDRMYPNICS